MGVRNHRASNRLSHNASRKSLNSIDNNELGPLQAAMQEAQEMAKKGYTNTKDPFLKVDESAKGGGGNKSKGSKSGTMRGSRRGSRGSRGSGGGMDASQLAPLDMDNDLPESFKITDGVWEKLQELRLKKFGTEIAVEQVTKNNKFAQKQYDRISAQETALNEIIDGMEKKREALLEKDFVLSKTMEILTMFKQGQDECDQDAIVTDYSDAKLIPMSLIDDTNALIKSLGDEKVKILLRTKKFRQRINYMNWEHQHMEMQAIDMQEHYTDLQMLRVTKQLKMVISGTKIDSDKVKAERVDTHMNKLMR